MCDNTERETAVLLNALLSNVSCRKRRKPHFYSFHCWFLTLHILISNSRLILWPIYRTSFSLKDHSVLVGGAYSHIQLNNKFIIIAKKLYSLDKIFV